ncbi:MAG: hypothetical protein AN484_07000 [Aphanizomenon flos-aquae WA102]|uniref:Uncharacterized protein n=1 Tax=Aphanizomenon flos-aquae WA102 TaxID=1710896 RepID=A0A1B7X4Y7_APHFL|nr:MAG: hypothetical protein AN484_07000 [Aphanizomenon flos-aquae WA102]
MNNVRQILNDWFANGFGEPPDIHKHLFWRSEYGGWQPKQDTITAFKANPAREHTFTVNGFTLHSCSGYNTVLLELPNGVWIEVFAGGIWHEYDGGYVVCFASALPPVSHIFKV